MDALRLGIELEPEAAAVADGTLGGPRCRYGKSVISATSLITKKTGDSRE